ncbi:MAG: diacylglycerol kinase family protein [Oscillospiraceae bacterium]|jgi:diacylglycerol kinase|nr:diacylglycerol kinase family protein [Oscillospiraceae bacterium]
MAAFFRSFRFAGRGVLLCLRERNFRFHLALSAYMYAYLLLYDWFQLSRGEWAALVLATCLVLAAEAANTALETAVDLASPGRNPLAAKAKDIAAGVVLLCALGALGVGLALLWQPEAFRLLAAYYRASPAMLGVLAASLVLSALFIFRKNRKG